VANRTQTKVRQYQKWFSLMHYVISQHYIWYNGLKCGLFVRITPQMVHSEGSPHNKCSCSCMSEVPSHREMPDQMITLGEQPS